MTADDRLRPRAFRLDEATVEAQPDPFAARMLAPEEQAIEIAQKEGVMKRRGFSWGLLFWSALGALLGLSFAVWLIGMIETFFARSAALGWIGLALLACVGAALAVFVWREVAGLLRQREIAALHGAFARARAEDDGAAARALAKELSGLYAGRPETAGARAAMADLAREIIDAPDLIDIAERQFMTPLDEAATREIAGAAKRVAAITAMSPRAMLDVMFVGAQALRLIRRMAEIYGGRPGLIGMARLARSVVGHLALTGGMATAGEALAQQLLGDGIMAKLSTRMAEGFANGALTARIGLSAMAVCRPMPFSTRKAPGIRDVAPFLVGGRGE